MPIALNAIADPAVWTETLLGERLVCTLLSRALYCAPDRRWLDRLIFGNVFADPPVKSQKYTGTALKVLQAWAFKHRSGLSEADFDVLEADYMALFVGPGKLLAPPWQSVYVNRDRVIFQMQTIRVNAFYERFELELGSAYREPADHIGLQFEFLTHLANRSSLALRDDNVVQLAELTKAQREFLREHMLRWVPRWRRDVAVHARTELYAGLADLACGVLEDLNEFLGVARPDLPSGP